MRRSTQVERRKFLVAALAGGGVAGCRASRGSWRFLTEEEAATLNAICEQIIPADDDPGAAWAGVVRYIDRQLAGHFQEHQKAYREGIAAVNRLAGRRFEELQVAQQQALLKKVEKNKQWAPFFNLVVAHAMQGFYGSPRHGGNRDWISWQMLKIPISPCRGRDHYDFTKGVKA